jgi:hypothetical protein
MGLGGRRSLFLAAGALEVVLGAVGLLSLVGVAFFVPATLFFIAAGRADGTPGRAFRSTIAVVVATVLGTGAFFALFQRDDPVCWATTSGGESVRLDPGPFFHGNSISMGSADLPPGSRESGCSSDFISIGEAATSTVLLVAMVLAMWVIASPRAPATSPVPVSN